MIIGDVEIRPCRVYNRVRGNAGVEAGMREHVDGTDDRKAGAEQGDGASDAHRSLVFFHGMGQQRRYEELARLAEALDDHLRQDPGSPLPSGIRVEGAYERSRTDPSSLVPFLRVFPEADEERISGPLEERGEPLRLYECYWAPIAGDGVASHEVLWWLLSQFPTPLRVMTARWRSRRRLRLSALRRMRYMIGRLLRHYRSHERVFAGLEEAYRRFCGGRAARRYPDGRFRDFLDMLGHGDGSVRLRIEAGVWGTVFLMTEILRLLMMMTLLLAVLLLASAICLLLVSSVQLLLSGRAELLRRALYALQLPVPDLSRAAGGTLQWPWAAALAAVSLTSLSFSRRFLRDYLGDVLQWTTYQETRERFGRRKSIMSMGSDMIRHVAADPSCTGVTILGHSLGSAIAFESLLSISRSAAAGARGMHSHAAAEAGPDLLPPGGMVANLITMGSPIDKMHYFFEGGPGGSYWYDRIVEQMRGDLQSYPFSSTAGGVAIEWLNFWDRGDIISGPLETPGGSAERHPGVINHRTDTLSFPDTVRCHNGYLRNGRVMRAVVSVALGTGEEPPGGDEEKNRWSTRLWLCGLLALPWLAGLSLAMSILGAGKLPTAIVSWSALILMLGLSAGWVLSVFRSGDEGLRGNTTSTGQGRRTAHPEGT